MRQLASPVVLLCLFVTWLASVPAARAAVPPEAVDLRNLGLAQLENERPEKAEETYRKLVKAAPEDPLGYANLAIALLRQQKNEEALGEIDKALAKAPGRGELLAIKADILQWSGQLDEALTVYEQAAKAAPENPEILYSLYRHTGNLESAAATRAAAWAAERLVRLRPENVVVLLVHGQQAIQEGDRTAATGAYLRLRELLWQAPPVAETALGKVLEALEGPDVSQARVPALRLENVLKITPMFRESLRELSTGIQGIPVARFGDEPPPQNFGKPVAVRFAGGRVAEEPTPGRALAVGDFDGDEKPDVARLRPGMLEVRLSGQQGAAALPVGLPLPASLETAGALTGLETFDLDNDGHLDLLAFGPGCLLLWRGDGLGGFVEAADLLGTAAKGGGAAVAAFDYDIEGDLDLALALPGGGAELLRNNLEGPLEAAGAKTYPALEGSAVRDLVVSDLDRDGDLDLVLVRADGLTWLDNLRQGRFADRSADAGLTGLSLTGLQTAVSADLDNDGWPDLVVGGTGGVSVLGNREGRFEKLVVSVGGGGEVADLVAFDADNDGRLDLATAGPAGIAVLGRQPGQGLLFKALPLEGAPAGASTLRAADLDGDGDLDLLAAGAQGLFRLTNEGGNANGWVSLRLRGLDTGNSKNNLLGLGTLVELRAGSAYQMREVDGDVTHFGLGQMQRTYLLRVVWNNGVPQQRLEVKGNQRVVEEQVLKGSCPFLYAWDGKEMRFVTDLLWGAPIGLPVAPGAWASADPEELVLVDGAVAVDGRYELRITEELWEAAFFDFARLWVVDHPAEVEVASSLRILPGKSLPEEVLASRDLRPPVAAWDGRGREVTQRVLHRDEVYADGYTESPYQGIAARPWTFTFDLGEAPAEAIRLHLDGWIFPADASLNLAAAQRTDLPWQPPRLEVEVQGETGKPTWQVLMPEMGFPAGKTKTLVIDTPPLPPGARKLRMVTTLWLHWDRIAWTPASGKAEGEVQVLARLEPASAELRYRGFSRSLRRAPNGPHAFDYHNVTADSPWLPLPGRYTRYGEVSELLETSDDRLVILAAGDEMALTFDASHLPPPPEGWKRTVFLESHGWDKDADRNTWQAPQLEPLPFRAMSGYPYGPGESYPNTEELRRYREEWLTREIEAPVAVPLLAVPF